MSWLLIVSWPLVVPLALLVGVSLGLLGGGGSILTVPILVYAVGIPAKPAIAASLVVVGVTSAVGALRHARSGTVAFRVALLFGATGIVGAWGGSRFVSGRGVPDAVLLGAFAALMVGVSTMMILTRGRPEPPPHGRSVLRILAGGLLTGFLTGSLGVGGGFLIVPMLLWVGRLSMHRAIGTSLVVIALNCAAGLAGYAGRVAIPWKVAVVFAGLGVAGSVLGAAVAARTHPSRLRLGFGVFVLVLGAAMLADQFTRG